MVGLCLHTPKQILFARGEWVLLEQAVLDFHDIFMKESNGKYFKDCQKPSKLNIKLH